MCRISVDFEKNVGRIKPVNGVGQPPFAGLDFSMFEYLKEANIPYSRLHDVGGMFGGNAFVDIPNLFRDFDADPEDPESYDFAFTDRMITSLTENGVEPFFRLGVTIENYAYIKAYRVFPPKDYLKWAKICEGVIKHYTEGWANGFEYNIRYWEIWNEPDGVDLELNGNWRGTPEEFYKFYNVAATYLKGKFPHLKIGGYASTGFYGIDSKEVSEDIAEATHINERNRCYQHFLKFFDGFMTSVKENGAPLDFFSWHDYSDAKTHMRRIRYVREALNKLGYENTESILNEWNYESKTRGTMFHAAQNTAILIAHQRTPIDAGMFYDARLGVSRYGGLFNPLTRKPFPLYYGFKAFGDLLSLGTEVFSVSDNEDVFVLAASGETGGGVLVVNIGENTELELDIKGQTLSDCKKVTEAAEELLCDVPRVLEENSIYYIKTKA